MVIVMEKAPVGVSVSCAVSKAVVWIIQPNFFKDREGENMPYPCGMLHVTSLMTAMCLSSCYRNKLENSHPNWMRAALSFPKQTTVCFHQTAEQFFLLVTS